MAWLNVITPITGDANKLAWTGYTGRILVPTADISYLGGSQLRVTWYASSLAGFYISKAYVQHAADSGDAYDFASTPTQILFGGNAYANISAAGNITSDAFPFILIAGKNLIFSFYVEAGKETTDDIRQQSSKTGWMAYSIAGDDAATVNTTGYVTELTNIALGVFKIETLVPSVTAFANSNAADGALAGWANQTNAYSDNGTYCTVAGTTKNQWYGNLFGFDVSALPAGASVINGTVTAQWMNSAVDTSGPEFLIGAQFNGTVLGSAVDTTGGTVEELNTYAPVGLTGDNYKGTGANGFWAVMRFRRTDNTTHTASVDYVKVDIAYYAIYNITGAENVQLQVIDAASANAKTNITAAEAVQLQVIDAASASYSGPAGNYNVTASEQVQLQAIDAAMASSKTNITAAEAFQLQVIDAVSASAKSPITVAEAIQLQVVDVPALTTKSPITVSEAYQLQVIDAAILTTQSPITATESFQLQIVDAVSLSAKSPLTIAEAYQLHVIDTAP